MVVSNSISRAQGEPGASSSSPQVIPECAEHRFGQLSMASIQRQHEDLVDPFLLLSLGCETMPPTSVPARSSSSDYGSGFHRPSFLQGFYTPCSFCRQRNQAIAKCYECNKYLCNMCINQHSRGRLTNFHHVYHFATLSEALSTPVTEVIRPNGRSTTSTNDSDHQGSRSHTDDSPQPDHRPPIRSRAVGAERQSSSENSRNSSRTSSYNLPSPTRSRQDSLHAIINANSSSMSGSTNTIFSVSSSLSFQSNTPLPPDSVPLVTSTPSNAPQFIASPRSAASPNVAMPTRNINGLSTQDEAAVAAAIGQGDSVDASIYLDATTDYEEVPPCVIHHLDYRFVCMECLNPNCTICVQERHMNHPLMYITECMSTVEEMWRGTTRQIQALQAELRQNVDILQRTCDKIEYKFQQTAIDVKCAMKRYINAIEAREEEHTQKLQQARDRKVELIRSQQEIIRTHYSKLAEEKARMSDPARYPTKFTKLLAVLRASAALKKAKNLGNIQPCEDETFMFIPPNENQLQTILTLGHVHVSNAPMSNSVMLSKQPLLYMNTLVSIPVNPLPAAKSRPIYGCSEIVAIKDFGRMPKLMWGKAGSDDGELCRPWGVTINRFGHFIISDRSNNRIQVFDTKGRFLFKFGTHGTGNGQFDRPAAVAINPNDDMVVADKDNHRIQVFNRHGEFLLTFGERGSQIGQFLYPWDVACDTMGNILVSDSRNHRVQLFRWNGIFIAKWGGDPSVPRLFDSPRGVAFDPNGNILMTDFNLHRVVMIERLTGRIRYIGREGRDRGQFNRPQGICCDDRGWFVVTDSRNYRYQVFNEKGEFMWMMGRNGKEEPGEMDRPCDVCVDQDGHLYVLDFGNDRIQVF